MRAVDVMRRAHGRSIDLLDPFELTYDAERSVPDPATGGYAKQTVRIGPHRVALFQRDSFAAERAAITDAARVDYGRRWGMLAPWTADDMIADPPEPDEFVLTGRGRFRLRDADVHRYRGEVWGIEFDLDRVA